MSISLKRTAAALGRDEKRGRQTSLGLCAVLPERAPRLNPGKKRASSNSRRYGGRGRLADLP